MRLAVHRSMSNTHETRLGLQGSAEAAGLSSGSDRPDSAVPRGFGRGTPDREPNPTRFALSHAAVIQLDELSSQLVWLRSVWEQLSQGHACAIDSFSTAARHYLVMRMNPEGTSLANCPRSEDVEMLRRGLLGERQKVIAIDSNKSHSTVTSRMGACLGCMGFVPRATRVPPLLVAAAVASTSRARLVNARLTRLEGGALQLVSIPRLDQRCAARLTPAERHVVRCIVDGMMHWQVSKHRTTAARTIANQLASAFRKLGVSGRSELLAFLAMESATAGAAPPSDETVNEVG